MSDWKKTIERRMLHMVDPHARYSMKDRFDDARIMDTLLNLAVDVESELMDRNRPVYLHPPHPVAVAFDKVRKLTDEC